MNHHGTGRSADVMFKRLRQQLGLGRGKASKDAESPISEKNSQQSFVPSVGQRKEQSEPIDPSNQTVQQGKLIIIDGRRYSMDELPKGSKGALLAIKRADQLILQRRQKIKLLKLARAKLEEQLRSGLRDQPSTRHS